MIKNPKLNQKVYFVGDKDEVCQGKISQIYNDPSVGIDNFLYLNKAYLFSTKSRAEKYAESCEEVDYLTHKRNFYEKKKKKALVKYKAFLK